MVLCVPDDFLTFVREKNLSHAAEQLPIPRDALTPDRRAGKRAGHQTVQAQQPLHAAKSGWSSSSALCRSGH